MIRLTIEGNVHKIFPVRELKRGYSQVVILHQPATEFRGRPHPEEFYVISIYSTSQTDTRFLKPEFEKLRPEAKALVYLKGERFTVGARAEYQYNHKLNLDQWQH